MITFLRLSPVIALFAVSSVIPARAQAAVKETPRHSDMDDATRFIFYSVLEGLYEDGLSSQDVDQILMKKDKQCYFHFIYACPICNPTIWALQAYRARPEQFYGMKMQGSTFGPGLPGSLHTQLYSNDPQQRLVAIHTLVKSWLNRRMKHMNLSTKDRAELIKSLMQKRKEGMKMLESFRHQEHGQNFGAAEAAPAYAGLSECAVCNGAVGKPMKLPEAKAK